MTITTISSREFNQDIGLAKQASLAGPVFITDRGKVAHVLVTIEEYQALTGSHENLLDILAMPETADIKFNTTKMNQFSKPTDFS